MIKVNGKNGSIIGNTQQLTTDFSLIVVSLIDTFVKEGGNDEDDVIKLLESAFRTGVRAYFNFKDGGIYEQN